MSNAGPPAHQAACSRPGTHDVIVVLVSGTLAEINSVGSGNLLDLGQRPRQADQLWGKL